MFKSTCCLLSRFQSTFLRFVVVANVLSLLSLTSAMAQEESGELAKKLSEVCRKHDVPALAAAAANKDGIIESACFGVRKRGEDDKVIMSDRFAIASNTKSMTAVVAAAMVEAEKIGWDSTIRDVWPETAKAVVHPDFHDVTLDELLSHQSGLPADLAGPKWIGFFNERQSPEGERKRMLKIVLSKKPAGPRKTFSYSNLGYVVAAAMLETVAKEPFESLARKHLFGPLGMKSADFRTMKTASKMKPPFIWSHNAKGKPFDPRLPGSENPSVYGSVGTVHLTIEDYAKYAHWQIKGAPAPVLKTQEAFDHLREPLVEKASGSKYACGWSRTTNAFGLTLSHAGSNTNSFALIWVLPESDVAAVVCTNTGERQAFAACDEIIAHLLMVHRTVPQ